MPQRDGIQEAWFWTLNEPQSIHRAKRLSPANMQNGTDLLNKVRLPLQYFSVPQPFEIEALGDFHPDFSLQRNVPFIE